VTRASEPFVVRHDATTAGPDPLIRLADVLITTSDGRPGHEQLAALFAEFPGLTLVLVVGAGRTVEIGARDGAVRSLRLDPSISVRFAAVALYHGWVGQFGLNDPRTR
jgi:hypothetical protein